MQSRNKREGWYAGKRTGMHYRTKIALQTDHYGWILTHLPSELGVALVITYKDLK
jgi:hypothetical protein